MLLVLDIMEIRDMIRILDNQCQQLEVTTHLGDSSAASLRLPRSPPTPSIPQIPYCLLTRPCSSLVSHSTSLEPAQAGAIEKLRQFNILPTTTTLATGAIPA